MFAVNFSFKATTAQLSYVPLEDLFLVGAAATNAPAAVTEDPAATYAGISVPSEDSVKTNFLQLIPAGTVLNLFEAQLMRKDQRIYVVITAQPGGTLIQLYLSSVS